MYDQIQGERFDMLATGCPVISSQSQYYSNVTPCSRGGLGFNLVRMGSQPTLIDPLTRISEPSRADTQIDCIAKV